ncbi:MAG TPA: hypothetical protein VHS31_03945 [Tepidisphaeraceae bacterium]|jgi:sugar phosphate isomerase/epimerase|nr:hypothetical protein [Tepidisphaeraceae bacterium]
MRNILMAVLVAIVGLAAAPETHVDHAGLSKLTWQLAARGSTFREMTTFEMIDTLHEMNFHHIELSPGQVLSADHADVKIDVGMPAEGLDALIAKLKSVKMDIVSFGAADFGGTEAEARKVFEFGKKLKVKTIISDPPPESLILLDKLANEYNINVALTSATTARRYVTCEIMLDAMKDRSKRIAVCADLMAWKLAGQDPIECVKKLSGHVVLVHLSDVDAEKHSVPVGAGTVDAAGAMTELKAQGFKGICCVDDDSDGQPARLAEFAKSVSAFSDMVTKLAAAP